MTAYSYFINTIPFLRVLITVIDSLSISYWIVFRKKKEFYLL